MSTFTFTIPGRPTGKARPRVTKWGTHNTDTTMLYENLVKLKYQESHNEISDKPLIVHIDACFEVPKSYSKKRKQAILDGKEHCTLMPDADNIAKIITDALNGIAYKDDKQIIGLHVGKHYYSESLVSVTITEVE